MISLSSPTWFAVMVPLRPSPRSVLFASLLMVLALEVLIRADQPPGTVDPGQIEPGMPAEEVRRLLGPPKTVARQILYGRYLEQWTYDAPAVRIEFDWRKGQPKKIQTVQTLGPPR